MPVDNEATRTHLAHLRWRCRRGMGELDGLLMRFLEQGYASLPAAQRRDFVRLLEQEDDQLWHWFLGRSRAPDPELQQLIDRILA